MGRLSGYMPKWLQSSSSSSSSSSSPSENAGGPKRRENNWVDGLRGIASLIVLTGHLNSGWAYYLHNPALSENGPSLLFQYPILRLVIGGRGAVATFFIITGYVNSLNPIKNYRADNVGPSLIHMSKSTFTRVGRLVLPTMIATTLSWFCSRIGLYNVGMRIDNRWYRDTSTFRESFWESLVQLFNNYTIFWYHGHPRYDPYHWTMAYILLASFRVYMVLMFLAFLRRRYMYLVVIFLYWFAWRNEDYYIGLNTSVGIFLAQLHRDLGSRQFDLVPRPIPAIIIILGLCIWSYPLHHPEWAWWSRQMHDFMKLIGPQEQNEISRFWVSVGPTVLMLGITFSRGAQWFLKLPFFNFLGRNSYAIYLLHHTMIRTVLLWMLYGYQYFTTPEFDDKGEPIRLKTPSRVVFCFVMPIFYIILYAVAQLWTSYVDTWCAKIVARLRSHVFREEEVQKEEAVPLTSVVARS
ncbi:hypothetical protein VTO42DRAFT_6134 [Malbranchea cinnamomea]